MQAILEKNFPVFAELTMKDSNQFHAVCLDTYPPCVYMNDVSQSVVSVIHKYNNALGAIKVSIHRTIYPVRDEINALYYTDCFVSILLYFRLPIHLMLDQMLVCICSKTKSRNSYHS